MRGGTLSTPATPPGIAAEIQLGGVWTDITDDVLVDPAIRITRGRQDEASLPGPGKCALSLLNRDGRYSPGNPFGPYYGLIGRNTPLRLSVRGATYLDVPGAGNAATPHTAALNPAGDLDVRIDLTAPRVINAPGTQWEIIGKYDNNGVNQRGWRLIITDGAAVLGWSTDGTGAGFHSAGTWIPPIPSNGRVCLRMTLDVDNGAGGWTVRAYTAPGMSGPWTQFGPDISGTGTTSVYATTVPLRIGATSNVPVGPPTMRVHAAEVRTGINGPVVAAPDFTAQAAGTGAFTDSAGRPWTVTGPARISDLHPRACGEVSSWPPDWDLSGARVVVGVEASGILRRLGQGKAALQSPMRRDLGAPTRPRIWAYWPCEDGTAATVLAAATPGVSPLQITGAVKPGAASSWQPSAPLPTIGAGSLSARVPAHSSTVLSLRCIVGPPAGGVPVAQPLITLTGTGTAATWVLSIDTDGDLALRAYSAAGGVLLDTTFWVFGLNGTVANLGINLTQTGSDVAWEFYSVATVASPDGSLHITGPVTGTLTSRTIGQLTGVTIGGGGDLGGTVVGHLAVADDIAAYAGTHNALLGWAGETAQARIVRLCGELGVPVTTFGNEADTTPMGVQAQETFLSLLDACAAADGGLLGEQIDEVGLAYRSRASLYNQRPALSLSYTARGEVPPGLRPVDDDQHVVNDVTVSRDRASSARVTLDTGPLSVQDPPAGVGRYDTSLSLNLFEDGQCIHVAGWMLHLGTVAEPRYPSIPINLAAGPHLITPVLELGLGDRVVVTDLPPWLPPGDVDQLVQGYTETIAPGVWGLTLNTSPASPWRVAQLADPTTGRLDTDGSQLAAGATSTAITLSVATTTGPTWTTNPADAPFDVLVGGERLTVVALGQQLAANPLLLSDLAGWTAQNATLTRTTAVVNSDAGAAASMMITPDGVSASGGVLGAATAPGSITPGQTYTVCMWAYSPGGWADVRPAVDWATAAGAFISSGLGVGTAVPAGQWTYIQQTFTAPASASMATPRARHGGTPPASAVWYAWAIRLLPTASISATSPQQMTVIRAVNGIAKAQAAGTPVALADPSMTLSL